MRRNEFTCSTCDSCRFIEEPMQYYCNYYKDVIRWSLVDHGCGSYASTNTGRVEIPLLIEAWGVRP